MHSHELIPKKQHRLGNIELFPYSRPMLRRVLSSCALLIACSEGGKPTAPPIVPANAVALTLLDIYSDEEVVFALLADPESKQIALPTEPCPATTVNLRLEGVVFPRPLSDDLFIAFADRLELPIVQVLFELSSEKPQALIALGGATPTTLVATIGDGLAIHQQARVPLLATPALIAAYSGSAPTSKATTSVLPIAQEPRDPHRARKAQDDNPIEMRVLGLAQAAGEVAVILVDRQQRIAFPLFIGFCQAASINAIFNHLIAPESSTHILFHELLLSARTTFAYARITELRADIFIGEIGLTRNQRKFVFDARPSDAIALALHTGAPIEVAPALLASIGEEAGPYLDLFAVGKRARSEFLSLGQSSPP